MAIVRYILGTVGVDGVGSDESLEKAAIILRMTEASAMPAEQFRRGDKVRMNRALCSTICHIETASDGNYRHKCNNVHLWGGRAL